MASPVGFTFLGSSDFYRSAAGVVPPQYAAILSVDDINYNTGTTGDTNNQKFINFWNSGSPAVSISGLGDPFASIVRLGNYNLSVGVIISAEYTIPSVPPTPLPNNPPIQLLAIQSTFSATSLDNARSRAGFPSPISMLSFLGQAPDVIPTTERASAPISNVFGSSWTIIGNTAQTGLGDTPVSSVSFTFASETDPIPENATISRLWIRVFPGAVTGDTNLLAAAEFWLEDTNSAIPI